MKNLNWVGRIFADATDSRARQPNVSDPALVDIATFSQNIYKYVWQMDLSSRNNVSSTDMLIATCVDLGICSISIQLGYG